MATDLKTAANAYAKAAGADVLLLNAGIDFGLDRRAIELVASRKRQKNLVVVVDGLYVIRTSVATADMSAQAAVLNYKKLAEAERAFRTLKGIDLRVHPIRHRLEGRVKAHIFLSMLAYYVQWHMIQAWAPLTFRDDAEVDAARASDPVAPAKRSQAALDKVHSRRLADGTPVASFGRLLAHLSTIVRSTMRPTGARPGEATFTLTTRPNAKQQQALDLIAAITV